MQLSVFAGVDMVFPRNHVRRKYMNTSHSFVDDVVSTYAEVTVVLAVLVMQ
jgi:hypothetical protein